MNRLKLSSWSRVGAIAAVLAGGLVFMPAPRANAQAIVLSVNGDPITSIDIEERMKLLRAFHRPASREAATESMIEDRLKSSEAAHFGISIKDNEIGEEVQIVAKRQKISANALMQNITRAGVSPEHARNHFKAQFGYSILIRALNRGVEASEVAVRSELAKEKGKGGITNYTMRQVVFTVNPGDPPSVIEASARQAQALRTRFTNCASGIPYAKSLPGVAVREKLVRSSTQLSDQIKEVLDHTPLGHLTEPSRSPNGIEMIAVCDRSASTNDDDLRKTISERILAQHYAEEEASKYREMRSRAIISRGP